MSVDEHTSSWHESVDMTAARTADIKMPAIQGLKRTCAKMMKIRALFSATGPTKSACSAKKAAPKKPTETAPESEKIIHIMEMRRALGRTRIDSAAIKRTRMCGCPKYPKPQARRLTTPTTVCPCMRLIMFGSMETTRSTVAEKPPKSLMTTIGAITSARHMSEA